MNDEEVKKDDPETNTKSSQAVSSASPEQGTTKIDDAATAASTVENTQNEKSDTTTGASESAPELATTGKSLADEATEYWMNHKQDIKKFLEWKMMQKMTNRALPTKVSQMKSDSMSNNPDEVEIASRMVEGFHQEDTMDENINPPPSKKLQAVPNPKTNKEPKRVRPKVAKDNRQRHEREWKFVSESTYKFYLQGEFLSSVSILLLS